MLANTKTTLPGSVPQNRIPKGIPAGLGGALIRPRPMGDVNAVMRDLDMPAGRVKALVEEGWLIGFDIAAVKQGRPELRVLTASVDFYRQHGGKKYHELEWPEIFRLIVPHSRLFVRGVEISRGLNCDRGHVENLILSGFLVCSKKSQRGPNGSPWVTRGSYENFLLGRLQ